MSAPVAFGPQFDISPPVNSTRDHSSVTGLADGRMVVVWRDLGSNGNEVKLRILNADGTPAGPERTVGTATGGTQDNPQITALAGGGFAVAWDDFSQGFGNVRTRVYDETGTAITAERSAHTNTTGSQQDASIAATADGGFVIGWWDSNISVTGLGSNSAGMGRAFDAAGTAAGGAVRISGNWGGDYGPVFAFRGNIGIAVWDDDLGPDQTRNGEDGIYARLLDGGLPSGAVADGGQRVDTGAFREVGRNPDVAIVALGAAVVWEDRPGNATTSDIYLSRDGNNVSRVNTTTTGNQTDAHVTALRDGSFVVVWSDSGAADGGDVRARVFDANGVATSADFRVTAAGAASAGVQLAPDVTGLADGRFVVTWVDPQGSTGVQGRIFDPRTGAVNLIGTGHGDQFWGTGFGDTIKGGLGADVLHGQAGADRLNGGAGLDTLTGGAGADSFIFALAAGAANVDRIVDFTSTRDKIVLENAIFTGLGTSLTASELRFGTAAQDGNDRLIYNAATGRLFFDADANGNGSQRLLAVLDIGTVLAATDFGLI